MKCVLFNKVHQICLNKIFKKDTINKIHFKTPLIVKTSYDSILNYLFECFFAFQFFFFFLLLILLMLFSWEIKAVIFENPQCPFSSLCHDKILLKINWIVFVLEVHSIIKAA
jgi:hypothetical protein